MAAMNNPSVTQDLIREILESSNTARRRPELDDFHGHLSALSRLDYRKALRGHFSRPQIRTLCAELRSFLPDLNREVFAETDLRHLAARARALGADFRARKFEGKEGRALRGFYVNDYSLLKRPLIVVNTAADQVAVAAAFWHEMGHHLTRAMFGAAHDSVSLYLSTAYAEHLDRPEEIVADSVTALAGYPAFSARRLFSNSKTARAARNAGSLISRVEPYLRDATGFNFDRRFSPVEKLHRLAGMVHLAKLREALLNEYGI
jgi:hypothetical protein